MRTLRIAVVVGVLLFAAGLAPVSAEEAPPPEALQVAGELFAVISPDMMGQLLEQTTNAFWPAVEEQMRSRNIDDATLAELRAEFQRIQMTNLTEMMKEAPPIYARHFSADELRQMVDFYKTPVGQKALTEMPRVMGDFFGKVQPYMQTLQDQMGEALTKILTAHGYGQ